jgi:hypothetical protein
MTALSHEQRLKNFQTALAIAGVSTNLMTCELIHSIAAMVDEKGTAFSIADAEEIKNAIQAKYQALQAGPTPPDLERLMREGKIMMAKKNPNPDTVKQEPVPEQPHKSLEDAVKTEQVREQFNKEGEDAPKAEQSIADLMKKGEPESQGPATDDKM